MPCNYFCGFYIWLIKWIYLKYCTGNSSNYFPSVKFNWQITMDLNKLKNKAAVEAVKNVESGMVLGLGTGLTANFAIREISRLLKEGSLKDIVGIPSSNQTEKLALELGIALISFEQKSEIDLNIDGADEVDPDLNLIKGGGGGTTERKNNSPVEYKKYYSNR